MSPSAEPDLGRGDSAASATGAGLSACRSVAATGGSAPHTVQSMSVTFAPAYDPAQPVRLACPCGSTLPEPLPLPQAMAHPVLGSALPGCTDAWCAAGIKSLDPELNVSNTNAGLLLGALGLEAGDLCGSLDAGDLYGRVLLALALVPADAGLPVTHTPDSGGRVVTLGGWREPGYLVERLTQLADIATAAQASGRPVVWA